MSVASQMEEKLKQAFNPSKLEVENQSHLHAGHAGDNGTGETHYHIYMVADHFDGQNRVQRQRAVYEILKDELAGPVHAMALTLKSPAETV